MEFFERTKLLLGSEAIEKLKSSSVTVVGIGGVGGHAAETLVRAGIGAINLVDFDKVDVTNINRQLVALSTNIGRPKTEELASRLLSINPELKVRTVTQRYTPETGQALLAPLISDAVLDCIDDVRAKVDLIVRVKASDVYIASALGAGNRLDATKLRMTDISKTSGCPLARAVRHELKKAGIIHHRVLFSSEPPLHPSGGPCKVGSVPWVPACAGMILASDVIMYLCGFRNGGD